MFGSRSVRYVLEVVDQCSGGVPDVLDVFLMSSGCSGGVGM